MHKNNHGVKNIFKCTNSGFFLLFRSAHIITFCLSEKLSSRLEKRKNESLSLQRRSQMMIHPLDILQKMSIL